MKLLFAVVDGGGNLPPQLAVARALRARGADLRITGHAGVRARVEAEGFSFEPLADHHAFDPTIQRSLPALMADFARVTLDRRFGHGVLAAAERFGADAVVMDMIAIAGTRVVLDAGIPTVVFVHCFYRGVQDAAAGPLGWLHRACGRDPMVAERRGALQIVAARRDLDNVKGAPPVRHVGVVWQGRPTAAVPDDLPRILVSLSTCAFAGQRRMLQRILDALQPLPVRTTVTVGPSIDAAGLRIPANAELHAWLDHDTVLRHASLLVGHGGHSTTMRALSFGVPVVVLPANPMIDQRGVGAAVQRAGAGHLLPKHAGPERIRNTVGEILGNPGYHRAAARLGESIRSRDGAQEAADVITAYVAGRSGTGTAPVRGS